MNTLVTFSQPVTSRNTAKRTARLHMTFTSTDHWFTSVICTERRTCRIERTLRSFTPRDATSNSILSDTHGLNTCAIQPRHTLVLHRTDPLSNPTGRSSGYESTHCSNPTSRHSPTVMTRSSLAIPRTQQTLGRSAEYSQDPAGTLRVRSEEPRNPRPHRRSARPWTRWYRYLLRTPPPFEWHEPPPDSAMRKRPGWQIASHVASVNCVSSETSQISGGSNVMGTRTPSNGPPSASPIAPPRMQPTMRSVSVVSNMAKIGPN